MRRTVLLVLLGIMALSASGKLLAADVDLKGITPGKWTMDFAVAKQVAKEKNLPILVNFSGSDWCGWCKIMEKNVFAKPAWLDYAKDNILMVIIDFPRDKTIVPKEYLERNNELKTRYDVEGFPTFVVLEDDGEVELGRLGAGKEKTPESFISELAGLFRYRPIEVERYIKTLKPQSRADYLSIVERISEANKAIKDNEKKISVAMVKIEEFGNKLVELKSDAQAFRAAQLGDEELEEYKKLSGQLEKAEKKLADWISSQPGNSEENMKKYQVMSATINELTAKISGY